MNSNGLVVSNYNDYINIRKKGYDGVVDCTRDGKCSDCGGCCVNELAMTKQEVKIIKDYIKKHNIKPKKTLAPTVEPVIDLTCPFLDQTVTSHRCQIYEVRPKICREFICSNPKRIFFELADDFNKLESIDIQKEFY